MGANSKIEWTHHSFNGWFGCTKVSPACDHCYAEHWTVHRFHKAGWGPHGERKRAAESTWREPVLLDRKAKAAGERHRVFANELSDVWDNQVPPEWRADLFDLIRKTPNLDWLLLTKRPQNIAKMLRDIGMTELPPNVWLGTTTENQGEYDRRWPILRAVPAVVHFISYEPALGPLTLSADSPDWVICGGESGPLARLMHPQWARALRDECQRKGVRFFMKQMTKRAAIPDDLLVREFPT